MRLVKLEDFKSASYNPRVIGKTAQLGLAESLRRFGDLGGIVWNKKTGNIITGHQRVDQLKAQGAKIEGDEIVIENGERFKVRVVDWPLSKEKAANVTANNQHIMGDFDEKLLAELLEDIKDNDNDIFFDLNLNLLEKIEEESLEEPVKPEDKIIENPDMKEIVVYIPFEIFPKIKKEINALIKPIGGIIIKK